MAPIFFAFINFVRDQETKNAGKVNGLCAILSIVSSFALYFSADVARIFDNMFLSIISIALSAVYILGLAILIYYIYVLFCAKFIKAEFKCFDGKTTLKDYFIVWAIIFTCWAVVWTFYFPGIATPDTYTQMYICNGEMPLSNNHPFLHTLLLYVTTYFTDFNPWLYTLVQMLVMSGIYAYLCYWMKKHSVWKWLWYAVIAFFAAFPVHTYNSLLIVKDSLFSAFVLLYSIGFYEATSTKGDWLKRPKNFLYYIITALLVTLFRSNGLMVVALTAVIGLIFIKKKYANFILANVISLTSYALVVYVLYPAMGVEATSISEAMAIPLQQLCCAIAEGHSLSAEIMDYMNKILPIEQIKLSYNPESVDNIKFNKLYNGDIIANDLPGFLKIWFAGLCQQPLAYVKAYLTEIEGLWNPVMKVGVFEPYKTPSVFMNAEMIPVFPTLSKIYDGVVNASYLSRYAFFSRIFYNPAAYFTVICLCGFVMKAKKRLSDIGALLPILALWVSVAVSMPRATVGRYVYAVFACIPLIVFVASQTALSDEKEDGVLK